MAKQENGPAWLDLAMAEQGTAEGAGVADNPRVLAYYRDAGHPEIQHDATAWCAAFASAMLERAGVPSAKTLSARDYLNWGKPLEKAQRGCVTVLWRGSPSSWTGHVGFCVGEDAERVYLLGGNQGDRVCIEGYPKSRVLGHRWPVTAGNSRTLRGGTAAVIGGGVAGVAQIAQQSIPELQAIGSQLSALGETIRWAAIAGTCVAIFASLVVIWARMDDLRGKGR